VWAAQERREGAVIRGRWNLARRMRDGWLMVRGSGGDGSVTWRDTGRIRGRWLRGVGLVRGGWARIADVAWVCFQEGAVLAGADV
jgi:hypothetical protein